MFPSIYYTAIEAKKLYFRISIFYEQGPSSFTNKLIEQIISDIDIHVDKTFGKSCTTNMDDIQRVHSLLTFWLGMKNGIIFPSSS